MNSPIEKIETMIYSIRKQKVMLDRDLAKLYGIETHRLNEAVKRNKDRFPSDFLIVPNSSELSDLISQFAILDDLSNRNRVFKNAPNLFTENGVAMLSSVLNSKTAIQINIMIMRTFTKLRSFLSLEDSANSEQEETQKLFKIVFERLDNTDEKLTSFIEAVTPKLPERRKKIGLK